MSENILAHALGAILSSTPGLYRIILPVSFDEAFKRVVAESLAKLGGIPVVVDEVSGPTAVGEAIAKRTVDDGAKKSAVVLIATEGRVSEIKSLEAYRDVLADGLPGGANRGPAIVTISALAERVANSSYPGTDSNEVAKTLEFVFKFLARAHEEVGNDGLKWTSSFWDHIDRLCAALPAALSIIPEGFPHKARNAVFMAAGLPRPDGGDIKYAEKNSPERYGKRIRDGWTKRDEIELSIGLIDQLEGGAGEHPICELPIEEYPSVRASFGHPVLASCFLGKDETRLKAWQGTSENAFFSASVPDTPDHVFYELDTEDALQRMEQVDVRGIDYVLTRKPGAKVDDKQVSLGRFVLRIRGGSLPKGIVDPCRVSTKLHAKTKARLLETREAEDGIDVEFELHRTVKKQGEKWREKPIVLVVEPTDASQWKPVQLKLFVPHPGRVSIIAIEEKGPRGNPSAVFCDETPFNFDEDTSVVTIDRETAGEVKLQLTEPRSNSDLIVVGNKSAPSWSEGSSLRGASPEAKNRYRLGNIGGDRELSIDQDVFRISAPEIEHGQVNPVYAAVLADNVVPAGDDLRWELLSDPRGYLEAWFQEQVLATEPSEQVKSCLGTVVLDSNSQNGDTIAWNEQVSAFADFSGIVSIQYPQVADYNKFWGAFANLGLGAIGGTTDISQWPSALDLRNIEIERVEAYLAAYDDLLDASDGTAAGRMHAYPFSAILFDRGRGDPEGALLSPLHPLRFAWLWSIQNASDEIARSDIYGKVSGSFLRFIDGEMLPVIGPSVRDATRWISMGLAAGPQELFAGWSLLVGTEFHVNHRGRAIHLVGRDLPFGTPSGLDHGGVEAALRDFLRVFPASPQLRIALTAPANGERYAETDEAIVAAASQLLVRNTSTLPGGIRILDDNRRKGLPPSASSVLGRIDPDALSVRSRGGNVPFEWTSLPGSAARKQVDVQFIEDSIVTLSAPEVMDDGETIGTSGGGLPISRQRIWSNKGLSANQSSFDVSLGEKSFVGLEGFASALSDFESMGLTGGHPRFMAGVSIGDNLLSGTARWTITGNRHLDPSALSLQLQNLAAGLYLWEWRPAFLSRENQSGAISSISSTHPYTVLAKPSHALAEEVGGILDKAGMARSTDEVAQLIASLGTRGIGLSSLLTMGHTQSQGALGFWLAFLTLMSWEENAPEGEARCVVPVDAVYPLLDLIGHGAKKADEQRRADLLLLSLKSGDDKTQVFLHPVEIKMRGGDNGNSFPGVGTDSLSDPLDQLSSSADVLRRVCTNYAATGGGLQMVNAAIASLVEVAFALRPKGADKSVEQEAQALEAIGNGQAVLHTSPGTLLWFQTGASAGGGDLYEVRSGATGAPDQFFANPIVVDDPDKLAALRTEFETSVCQVLPPLVEETLKEDQDPRPEKGGERQSAEEPGVEKTKDEVVADAGRATTLEETNPATGSVEASIAQLPGKDEVVSPGIEVHVGSDERGSEKGSVWFKPSETRLNQLNVGVVGDLGTGKTQFLKSFVFQIARSGGSNRNVIPKFFIFDYKKDYQDQEFIEAVGGKVLDTHRLPVNFFAIPPELSDARLISREKVRRANFFADLLRRVAQIGQVQRNDLYASIMEAYNDSPEGQYPTVDDVFDQYSARGKNDSVISVLTLLRDLEVFENDPSKTASFVEVFDRTTVLKLGDLGGAGQDIVDIVATMFLDHLYTDYMKTRPKPPFITGEDGISRRQVDSFVLIDEAHHALNRDFDVLMNLMLEGREFGMGVVLSSQYLSHFDAGKHDWSEGLSTWVVHAVRNATAKQFERIGFRGNLASMAVDVAGLKPHMAYFRCANGYNDGVLMKGKPFFEFLQKG